jgi:outer membrane lipoprotein-sorting protein
MRHNELEVYTLTKMLTRCLLLTLALSSARQALVAEDLSRVLRELTAAALKFRTATADFEWRTDQTEPVPDTETQAGTIYFSRTNSAFQMAARIRIVNQKDVQKVLTYSNSSGTATLYEKRIDSFRVFKAGDRQSQLESVLLLGFGASGQEIESKWNVSYVRTEILTGIRCDVLELVPKDLEMRRSLAKVTIWVDASRAVTLKQVFDQGQGNQRTCVYSDLKVNTHLPRDAFNPKADVRTK